MMTKSKTLTKADAVYIWRRRQKGLFQHQIAAELGCNQGRVSEVLTGKKFSGTKELI